MREREEGKWEKQKVGFPNWWGIKILISKRPCSITETDGRRSRVSTHIHTRTHTRTHTQRQRLKLIPSCVRETVHFNLQPVVWALTDINTQKHIWTQTHTQLNALRANMPAHTQTDRHNHMLTHTCTFVQPSLLGHYIDIISLWTAEP